jgi:hypothetical protein
VRLYFWPVSPLTATIRAGLCCELESGYPRIRKAEIMAIKIHKVPTEFKKQAHDQDYICEHFYPILLSGQTIDDEGIDGIAGYTDSRNVMYAVAMCWECERQFDENVDVVFELQYAPFKEEALFERVK